MNWILLLSWKMGEVLLFHLSYSGTKYLIEANRRCSEALFQKELLGDSLPELIASTISKMGADTREEMSSNIVLVGGSSKFPGFDERLTKELSKLLPHTPRILAPKGMTLRQC